MGKWANPFWRFINNYWAFIVLFTAGLAIATFLDRFIWCNLVTVRDVKQCTVLGQSAWEWIKLLIGPIIVAITGIVLNRFFKFRDNERKEQENTIAKARLKQEKEIEEDRLKQNALIDYFDQMTQLFLSGDWPNSDGKLESTTIDKPIVALAKARTFTLLNELDSKRKGFLIHFLFEAKVLRFISLRRSNLHDAYLHKAKLYKTDLHKADLSRADLSGADLYKANLYRANLKGTNLYKANLFRAKLYKADLDEANLTKAKSMTKRQIEAAKNWKKAYYTEDFCKELGIPFTQPPDSDQAQVNPGKS